MSTEKPDIISASLTNNSTNHNEKQLNSERKPDEVVTKPVIYNYEEDLAARVVEINDFKLTRWQAIKKYPFACFCILIMIWSLILTSFESQAGSIVISISQFRKHFGELQPDGTYVIAAKWQSSFSGVPLATQIIGQLYSSDLVDRFGKKKVIFVAIGISIAFIGMEFASKHVQLFLAGKTLNGFMLGIMQPACVSYVTDVAPLVLRGSATSLCNISFSLGPLVCFIINYSLTGKGEDDAWAYRAIFASQWGFAVVSLGLLLLVPESPTYLIMKGDYDAARKSYSKLLKDDVAVEEQLQVVRMTIEEAKSISKNSNFFDLFKGLNFKRTMVSVISFISHPFSGVYFTGNYTTYYFQLSGFDDAKSFRFTCGAQSISTAGCLASLWVVERAGRRNGLLYGLGCIIIVDLIIAGAGTAQASSQGALNTTIAFMMLYGGVYNAGVGCIPYTIAAENPTSSLRAKTISLCLFASNAFSMMWSFVLPYIFNPNRANLGAKTMFIFAGCSIVIWVYLFFFQTETKGRTYDEVDELYAARIPLRNFKGYVTRTSALNNEATENTELKNVKGKPKQEHSEDVAHEGV